MVVVQVATSISALHAWAHTQGARALGSAMNSVIVPLARTVAQVCPKVYLIVHVASFESERRGFSALQITSKQSMPGFATIAYCPPTGQHCATCDNDGRCLVK
jgi:hypothetical protein